MKVEKNRFGGRCLAIETGRRERAQRSLRASRRLKWRAPLPVILHSQIRDAYPTSSNSRDGFLDFRSCQVVKYQPVLMGAEAESGQLAALHRSARHKMKDRM